MAGRPRTMVRKIEALELAAYELAEKLLQIIPEQYLAQEGDLDEWSDRVAASWRYTLDGVVAGWLRLRYLNGLLRQKAGLSGYGPTGGFELVRRGALQDYRIAEALVEVSPAVISEPSVQ